MSLHHHHYYDEDGKPAILEHDHGYDDVRHYSEVLGPDALVYWDHDEDVPMCARIFMSSTAESEFE